MTRQNTIHRRCSRAKLTVSFTEKVNYYFSTNREAGVATGTASTSSKREILTLSRAYIVLGERSPVLSDQC
jgi:hypothetical protein